MSGDTRVCLLVLSGLPGCGKSSFSDLFSKYLATKNIASVHVCYDDLIGLDEQADMRTELGAWKAERKKIVAAVEELIKLSILGQKGTDVENSYIEKINIKELIKTSVKTVVLIDDNNYLSSMRYEYYQVARDLRLGFAQLHFTCDVELALKFNSNRSGVYEVPEEVIKNMSTKMEPPNPLSNKWEAFSFSIPVLENVSHNLDLILSIVDSAIANPATPVETVSEEVREKDRVACSASVIHQVDKHLRVMVNKRIIELKTKGLDKEEMRKLSHNIYSVKGEVLEDLKTGFSKLDKEVVNAVHEREDGSGSKLALEIEELFNKKLKI